MLIILLRSGRLQQPYQILISKRKNGIQVVEPPNSKLITPTIVKECLAVQF